MPRIFCTPRIVTLLASMAALLALLLVPRVAQAKTGAAIGEPLHLEVPGSPDAFYYKPRAKGPKPS